MAQLNLDTSLYPSKNIITIVAPNYFEAFSQLAVQTKPDIDQLLNYYRKSDDYKSLLSQARNHLTALLGIRQRHSSLFLTSDLTNHLENYMESFCGYCQGAGIDLEEGALLQLELEGGCQSLVVRHNQTGLISGFHLEEDSTAYDRFGSSQIGKFWVDMTVGSKKISFLAYAGLTGFGYSAAVASSPLGHLFSVADVLESLVVGPVWSNAVCFMLGNCTSLDLVKELIKNLSRLPGPKFIGGYTLTFFDTLPSPEIIQIEFGGDLITTIKPFSSDSFSYFTGLNYPHHPYLVSIDAASEVESPDTYDLEGLRKVYRDRQDRLALAARQLASDSKPIPFPEAILASLQNKAGVWRHEWFTGFSNIYVANHLMFQFNPHGDLQIKVVANSPSPLALGTSRPLPSIQPKIPSIIEGDFVA